MEVFQSILAVLLASCISIMLFCLLGYLESAYHIKRYNKTHKGQFNEFTSPFEMSKRYREWYIENFANMKEGFYDEPSERKEENNE